MGLFIWPQLAVFVTLAQIIISELVILNEYPC